MKNIDKSISISLDILHYHTDDINKYDKLLQYVDKVKTDRNSVQDLVTKIRETIIQNGFNDTSQEIIKELLDIQ